MCTTLGDITVPKVVTSSPVHLSSNTFILSMKCIPDETNFDYVWEKRNGDLPTRAQRTHSPHMKIVNLLPEDSGDYRCVMSNFTGRIASNFSTLIVKGTYHYNYH